MAEAASAEGPSARQPSADVALPASSGLGSHRRPPCAPYRRAVGGPRPRPPPSSPSSPVPVVRRRARQAATPAPGAAAL